jgi:hypothetical protein
MCAFACERTYEHHADLIKHFDLVAQGVEALINNAHPQLLSAFHLKIAERWLYDHPTTCWTPNRSHVQFSDRFRKLEALTW